MSAGKACAITTEAPMWRVSGMELRAEADVIAVEEPLAVDVEHGPAGARESFRLLTTMRTPGSDRELVRGLLLTEGVVASAEEAASLALDEGEDAGVAVVRVSLAHDRALPPHVLGRSVRRPSACGVCGSATLDAVRGAAGAPLPPGGLVVRAEVLARLPSRMADAQDGFRRTGGMHAAALFSADGELLALREDVGRHNALDKLLGASLGAPGVRLDACVLVLSSRASFELVQKAWVARVPVVATVGAPTSLAVEAAKEANLTLAGFVRPSGFNLYSGEERVVIASAESARGATP